MVEIQVLLNMMLAEVCAAILASVLVPLINAVAAKFHLFVRQPVVKLQQ